MIAYKGFNKDMTCRGFQYEEGKEYETDSAKLCESGFHACENLLDCFKYYAPGQSIYHKVDLEDNGERNDDDTKVVGKKIKIGAKLSVGDICKLHFEFTKENCIKSKNGYRSALNGGDMSALNGGDMSALNGGDRSALNGGKFSVVYGGEGAKVKGGLHSVLALQLWENYELKEIKAAIVDGEIIKADTWYKLENGEFVEVEDDE